MVRFYLYRCDAAGSALTDPMPDSDWDLRVHLEDKVLAEDWEIPCFDVLGDEPLPDFPDLVESLQIPIFSERAWRLLSPLLASTCEALPIQVESEGDFLFCHVIEAIDALDQDRSECRTLLDGRLIAEILAPVWYDDRIAGRHIFRLPTAYGGGQVYVSEEFRRVVEANGLKGLRFKALPKPRENPATLENPASTPSELGITEGTDEIGRYLNVAFGDAMQRFRWISPGQFVMGSPKNEHQRAEGTRELQRRVTLTKGFWLADTACNQQLWMAIMQCNPSVLKGADHPVTGVTWDEVQRFLELCSQVTGRTFRLPTDAEWEYACRAGTTTPFSFGTTVSTAQVNYRADQPYPGGEVAEVLNKTVDVKARPANVWGLYQMHGNVWEWCSDRFSEEPTGDVDPVGHPDNIGRVIRGGSGANAAAYARSACRETQLAEGTADDIGFRIALMPTR